MFLKDLGITQHTWGHTARSMEKVWVLGKRLYFYWGQGRGPKGRENKRRTQMPHTISYWNQLRSWKQEPQCRESSLALSLVIFLAMCSSGRAILSADVLWNGWCLNNQSLSLALTLQKRKKRKMSWLILQLAIKLYVAPLFYEPLVKKRNAINIIAKSHLLQNILISKMLNVKETF